jgi:hypothetical protein
LQGFCYGVSLFDADCVSLFDADYHSTAGRLIVNSDGTLNTSPGSEPGASTDGKDRKWDARGCLVTAGICAPLYAYFWSRPLEPGTLGPHLERLSQFVPLWVTVAIIFAWRGHLRSGLLLLLVFLMAPLMGTIPEFVAAAASWPGGWEFGVAGLIAGAAYGWLCPWLLWTARDARSTNLSARQAAE